MCFCSVLKYLCSLVQLCNQLQATKCFVKLYLLWTHETCLHIFSTSCLHYNSSEVIWVQQPFRCRSEQFEWEETCLKWSLSPNVTKLLLQQLQSSHTEKNQSLQNDTIKKNAHTQTHFLPDCVQSAVVQISSAGKHKTNHHSVGFLAFINHCVKLIPFLSFQFTFCFLSTLCHSFCTDITWNHLDLLLFALYQSGANQSESRMHWHIRDFLFDI